LQGRDVKIFAKKIQLNILVDTSNFAAIAIGIEIEQENAIR